MLLNHNQRLFPVCEGMQVSTMVSLSKANQDGIKKASSANLGQVFLINVKVRLLPSIHFLTLLPFEITGMLEPIPSGVD